MVRTVQEWPGRLRARRAGTRVLVLLACAVAAGTLTGCTSSTSTAAYCQDRPRRQDSYPGHAADDGLGLYSRLADRGLLDDRADRRGAGSIRCHLAAGRESFSLAAASLLTDVCGGNSTHAAALAGAKAHADAARQARAAICSAGLPRLHLHPGVEVVSWRGARFRRRRSLGLGLAARLHVVVVGGFPSGPFGLDFGGPGRQLVQPRVQRRHPARSVSPRLVGLRLRFPCRLGGMRGRRLTVVGGVARRGSAAGARSWRGCSTRMSAAAGARSG